MKAIEEKAVCDGCGREEIDEGIIGWLELRRHETIDTRTHSDFWSEKHFCSWDCLRKFSSF